MARTTGPTQADILLNENSVLAARSRRILQSLLGPTKDGAQAKTDEELEDEDAEAFKPEPDELLGPGFPITGNDGPLPGIQIGQSLRADEKLRKYMLGKNAKRPVSGLRNSGRLGNTAKLNENIPTKPKLATTSRSAESDEEGRSSLGKTKRRKTEQTNFGGGKEKRDEESEQATVPEVAKTPQTPVVVKAKKKPGSYLDEILSDRSKKKEQKKRKGPGQHGDKVK